MKNNGFFHNIWFFVGQRTVVAAALICLVVAAVSCRTIQTVEVPVPVHDTTYVTNNVHDSVFVENTTTEYVKGDTVFINKTKIKYVEKLRTDTLVRIVERPVELTKTEYVEVEKELSWLQKTLIGMGVCSIASLLLLVVVSLLGLKKK